MVKRNLGSRFMLFVMPQTIKTLLKMFHNWAGKTRGKTHLVLARKERERKKKRERKFAVKGGNLRQVNTTKKIHI